MDPRVEAKVHLIGEEPSQVSYSELLTILYEVYGYTGATKLKILTE